MSRYTGWALKLRNGKYMDDAAGKVGPALFVTRREARAVQSEYFRPGESVIVKVTVTVKAQ